VMCFQAFSVRESRLKTTHNANLMAKYFILIA